MPKKLSYISRQPVSSSIFNMKQFTKYYCPINVLSILTLILILIWPINGTYGLKNILIFTCATLSIYVLIHSAEFATNILNRKTLLVLIFFLWIIVQSFLISPFPEHAQKQLRSVWLATALAALTGLTLGLRNKDGIVRTSITISLISFPFVYFVNYLVVCYQKNNFSIPVFNTDFGIYGDKTKIIFFGMLALATSLHMLFKSIQKKDKKNSLIFLVCTVASYLSFILVGSKSGVMQGAILFLIAMLFVVRQHLSRQVSLVLVSIGIIIGIAGIWQVKNDAGWANFQQSIQAGMNLEKYQNWKNYPESGLPLVDGKYQTQESAYLRANGIVLGIKCLATQPLGHGYLSEPLQNSNGTCELARQTRIFTTLSAMLDFLLVVGIPGVLILSILLYESYALNIERSTNPLPFNKIIPFALILPWIFSEISDTHYYESTFFVISLLLGSNISFISTNQTKDYKNI